MTTTSTTAQRIATHKITMNHHLTKAAKAWGKAMVFEGRPPGDDIAPNSGWSHGNRHALAYDQHSERARDEALIITNLLRGRLPRGPAFAEPVSDRGTAVIG